MNLNAAWHEVSVGFHPHYRITIRTIEHVGINTKINNKYININLPKMNLETFCGDIKSTITSIRREVSKANMD